jgi:hypothetical protein
VFSGYTKNARTVCLAHGRKVGVGNASGWQAFPSLLKHVPKRDGGISMELCAVWVNLGGQLHKPALMLGSVCVFVILALKPAQWARHLCVYLCAYCVILFVCIFHVSPLLCLAAITASGNDREGVFAVRAGACWYSTGASVGRQGQAASFSLLCWISTKQ